MLPDPATDCVLGMVVGGHAAIQHCCKVWNCGLGLHQEGCGHWRAIHALGCSKELGAHHKVSASISSTEALFLIINHHKYATLMLRGREQSLGSGPTRRPAPHGSMVLLQTCHARVRSALSSSGEPLRKFVAH